MPEVVSLCSRCEVCNSLARLSLSSLSLSAPFRCTSEVIEIDRVLRRTTQTQSDAVYSSSAEFFFALSLKPLEAGTREKKELCLILNAVVVLGTPSMQPTTRARGATSASSKRAASSEAQEMAPPRTKAEFMLILSKAKRFGVNDVVVPSSSSSLPNGSTSLKSNGASSVTDAFLQRQPDRISDASIAEFLRVGGSIPIPAATTPQTKTEVRGPKDTVPVASRPLPHWMQTHLHDHGSLSMVEQHPMSPGDEWHTMVADVDDNFSSAVPHANDSVDALQESYVLMQHVWRMKEQQQQLQQQQLYAVGGGDDADNGYNEFDVGTRPNTAPLLPPAQRLPRQGPATGSATGASRHSHLRHPPRDSLHRTTVADGQPPTRRPNSSCGTSNATPSHKMEPPKHVYFYNCHKNGHQRSPPSPDSRISVTIGRTHDTTLKPNGAVSRTPTPSFLKQLLQRRSLHSADAYGLVDAPEVEEASVVHREEEAAEMEMEEKGKEPCGTGDGGTKRDASEDVVVAVVPSGTMRESSKGDDASTAKSRDAKDKATSNALPASVVVPEMQGYDQWVADTFRGVWGARNASHHGRGPSPAASLSNESVGHRRQLRGPNTKRQVPCGSGVQRLEAPFVMPSQASLSSTGTAMDSVSAMLTAASLSDASVDQQSHSKLSKKCHPTNATSSHAAALKRLFRKERVAEIATSSDNSELRSSPVELHPSPARCTSSASHRLPSPVPSSLTIPGPSAAAEFVPVAADRGSSTPDASSLLVLPVVDLAQPTKSPRQSSLGVGARSPRLSLSAAGGGGVVSPMDASLSNVVESLMLRSARREASDQRGLNGDVAHGLPAKPIYAQTRIEALERLPLTGELLRLRTTAAYASLNGLPRREAMDRFAAHVLNEVRRGGWTGGEGGDELPMMVRPFVCGETSAAAAAPAPSKRCDNSMDDILTSLGVLSLVTAPAAAIASTSTDVATITPTATSTAAVGAPHAVVVAGPSSVECDVLQPQSSMASSTTASASAAGTPRPPLDFGSTQAFLPLHVADDLDAGTSLWGDGGAVVLLTEPTLMRCSPEAETEAVDDVDNAPFDVTPLAVSLPIPDLPLSAETSETAHNETRSKAAPQLTEQRKGKATTRVPALRSLAKSTTVEGGRSPRRTTLASDPITANVRTTSSKSPRRATTTSAHSQGITESRTPRGNKTQAAMPRSRQQPSRGSPQSASITPALGSTSRQTPRLTSASTSRSVTPSNETVSTQPNAARTPPLLQEEESDSESFSCGTAPVTPNELVIDPSDSSDQHRPPIDASAAGSTSHKAKTIKRGSVATASQRPSSANKSPRRSVIDTMPPVVAAERRQKKKTETPTSSPNPSRISPRSRRRSGDPSGGSKGLSDNDTGESTLMDELELHAEAVSDSDEDDAGPDLDLGAVRAPRGLQGTLREKPKGLPRGALERLSKLVSREMRLAALAIMSRSAGNHETAMASSTTTTAEANIPSTPTSVSTMGGSAIPSSPSAASTNAPRLKVTTSNNSNKDTSAASSLKSPRPMDTPLRAPPKCRVAVVISISTYADARILSQPQCDREGDAIASLLEGIGFAVTRMSMGSNVPSLQPTTRDSILKVIDEATKSSCKTGGTESVALVYVCGGGFMGPLSVASGGSTSLPLGASHARSATTRFGVDFLSPSSSAVVLPSSVVLPPLGSGANVGIPRDQVLTLQDLQLIPAAADPTSSSSMAIVVIEAFNVAFTAPSPSTVGGFALIGGRKSIGHELVCIYEPKYLFPCSLYLHRALSGWATRDSRLSVNSINAYICGHLLRRGIFAVSTASPFFIGDLDLATVQELRFCRQEIRDIRNALHGKLATLSLQLVPLRNQDPTSAEFIRSVRLGLLETLREERIQDHDSVFLHCMQRSHEPVIYAVMRSVHPNKFFTAPTNESSVFQHTQTTVRELRQRLQDPSIEYKPTCFGSLLLGEITIRNAFTRDAFLLTFENSKRIRHAKQLRKEWLEKVRALREEQRLMHEQQQALKNEAFGIQTPVTAEESDWRTPRQESEPSASCTVSALESPSTEALPAPPTDNKTQQHAPPTSQIGNGASLLSPVSTSLQRPSSPSSKAPSTSFDQAHVPRVILTANNAHNISGAIALAAIQQAKPDVSRAAGFFRSPIDAGHFTLDGGRYAVHELGYTTNLTFLTTEFIALKLVRAIRSAGQLSRDCWVRTVTTDGDLNPDVVMLHRILSRIQSLWRGYAARKRLHVILPTVRSEVGHRHKIAGEEKEWLQKIVVALRWNHVRIFIECESKLRSDLRDVEHQAFTYLFLDRVHMFQRAWYTFFTQGARALEREEVILRSEIEERKEILWGCMLDLILWRRIIRLQYDEWKKRCKMMEEGESKQRNIASQFWKVERSSNKKW